MQFLRNITWEEAFASWRKSEANEEKWIDCATKLKGWPNWESWRRFTAEQIKANTRKWYLYSFDNPLQEIPQMYLGPYPGWRNKMPEKELTTFAELIENVTQRDLLQQDPTISRIIDGLPFDTQLIGLRTPENNIVCIEGHHRAAAIALASQMQKVIDFSRYKITIALADLTLDEGNLLNNVLLRGTDRR